MKLFTRRRRKKKIERAVDTTFVTAEGVLDVLAFVGEFVVIFIPDD